MLNANGVEHIFFNPGGERGLLLATIAKYRILGKTGPPAVDWGRYNINVNCITPGVKHPLTRRTIAAWATPEQINERIPLAYMGESRGSG